MPEKHPPPPSIPPSPGDVSLAVKDVVRGVRFNLRRSAENLANSVEAAMQHREGADASGPLSILAEPIGKAVSATTRMLLTADRAAVHLLAQDKSFRDMLVPLCSSAAYFSRASTPDELRLFTQDHFWRYRHWLRAKGWSDLFVHQQGFQRAGQRLAALRAAGHASVAPSTEGDAHRRRLADAILALGSAEIFASTACMAKEDASASAELAWRAAICAVLAGEIAATLTPLDHRHQTEAALALADEITVAQRPDWAQSLRGAAPAAAIAQWLAFVLRHL
ncbi:hypothetical protein [Verminephrobacter eiseniae]|uniref:hypothetical protein n=1 Tax=Verminephrobacter eiseniae TaxID=364317 RepID=UPI002236FC64|nr:hypothetical protein [Verminephrobacter eiseniae]